MNDDQSDANNLMDVWVKGLGILPQNLVSLAVGGLVRAKLPKSVAYPVNKLFVKTFGINMAEAERPLGAYDTIEDIFTRRLQRGSRRVAEGFVSPADGKLVRSEPVVGKRAVQAKGITYSVADLVFGSGAAPQHGFDPSWFTTVYLAPHNYHRVHTPVPALVTALRYIPGRLWPVNAPAVRTIPGLFCRNERLVFDLELASGGKMWVVMVGAMNVGRMVTPLDPSFVSNASVKSTATPRETKVKHLLAAGDELGTFMLGSTVVMVMDGAAQTALSPKGSNEPVVVQMGQSLSQ